MTAVRLALSPWIVRANDSAVDAHPLAGIDASAQFIAFALLAHRARALPLIPGINPTMLRKNSAMHEFDGMNYIGQCVHAPLQFGGKDFDRIMKRYQ